MRIRSRLRVIVISLVVMFSAALSLSPVASAAPYGEGNYGEGTYDCTSENCETLTDTGDTTLYIGIGAVVLSAVAISTLLIKKKPKSKKSEEDKPTADQ